MKLIGAISLVGTLFLAVPSWAQIDASPPEYPAPGSGSGGAFGPGYVDVSRLPNSTPGESSFSPPPSPTVPGDYPGPAASSAPVKTQGKASINQEQIDENAASSPANADTAPNDADVNDGTSSDPDNGPEDDSNGVDEQPNSESPETASTP